MNITRGCILILLIISSTTVSQSNRDTSKAAAGKKDDAKQLNIIPDEPYTQQQNHFDVQNDLLRVPLNLKIYQKVLLYELKQDRRLSSEELDSGMTLKELDAFYENKKLTQKMLTDIYGEDLIDLRKILASLGITEQQLRLLAGILKFIVLGPHL